MIVQKPEAERRLGKKLSGKKTDWFLLSSSGTRRLGGPYSKSQAQAQERAVQYWKHQQNPKKNPKKNPGMKLLLIPTKWRAVEFERGVWGVTSAKESYYPTWEREGAGAHAPEFSPSVRLDDMITFFVDRGKPSRAKSAAHRLVEELNEMDKKGISESRMRRHAKKFGQATAPKLKALSPLTGYDYIKRGDVGDRRSLHIGSPGGATVKYEVIITRKKGNRLIVRSRHANDYYVLDPVGSLYRLKESNESGRALGTVGDVAGVRMPSGDWASAHKSAQNPKKNPKKNPIRKVAEMHPDDRAIVGSAIGSAAGYMISPAVAPLGAAAGHIAGKRLGRQPRRNPGRSLSDIAKEIRQHWRQPWHAGPEDRVAAKIRESVKKMETESPRKWIGDFLANSGGWRGRHAVRIKDELRQMWKALDNPRKKMGKEERAAIGAAVGGVGTALVSPVASPAGAAAGAYVGAQMNPRPFGSRTHDWSEVLIQAGGKRITRKQIRDYYWRNRKKIWPFLEGQTVLVVMAPRKNEFVLIRKRGSDDKYIKLTKLDGIDDENSFEYWVNRRVVEFHPVLTGKRTPILWLDLDIHARTKAKKTALRAKAKKAMPKLRKIMRKFGAEKIYAYDSGIGGYHLEGALKAPKGVDKLRKDFTRALKEAFADDPAFTTGIAKTGQIRLDTTTMHTLGSLRAPHSFTVTGGTKKRI